MELNNMKPGLRVKITKLGNTRGMLIDEQHLNVRAVGVTGTIKGHVPGHGGDVWWVEQDDGKVGAYVFDEFELE